MAMLISQTVKNNNRLTSSVSASSATKWAGDRARISNDYLCDAEASFDTGGGSVVEAFANWKDKNYTSSCAYFYNASAAAGLHKKYAHGPMWRHRKILKRIAQNRATYNASTTVQT